MKISTKDVKLAAIHSFLWECGVSGATLEQIANKVNVKSESYLRILLQELIKNGKAVAGYHVLPKKHKVFFAAWTNLADISKMDPTVTLYTPIDTWTFDDNHCFLCGIPLDALNRTEEHIIPKWLQRIFNLWNQRLTLPNGTDIPYKQLTIPCCQTCNRDKLGPIENSVRSAYEQGINAFRQLPPLIIYQWTLKIFYGLLFKDLSLLRDRRDPSNGYILTDKDIKSYSTLHHFLQSVRLPYIFRGFQPWSIFILPTLTFGDERDFDYIDALSPAMFSIRMGEIGLIVCLEDFGVEQDTSVSFINELQALRLDPLQFSELVAVISYRNSLVNRNPTYLIKQPKSHQDPIEVTCTPFLGLSNKPMYNEWDVIAFSHTLHQHWQKYGIEYAYVFEPPNLIRTRLYDQEKNLLQFDQEGNAVSIPITKY